MNEVLWHTLNYRDLKKEGYAVYSTDSVGLVFALRGNCMIDVFDQNSLRQVAYLDFDISKRIMLESAFTSPVIGLPFTNQFRENYESRFLPLKDLRSNHSVGFYIDSAYRNKGQKEIWNLDEMMMAIAFETAFECQVEDFTIKPTGDTKRYYEKKFHAKICHKSRTDLVMTVHLKSVRKTLRHIRIIEKEGRTVFFRVKGQRDLMT